MVVVEAVVAGVEEIVEAAVGEALVEAAVVVVVPVEIGKPKDICTQQINTSKIPVDSSTGIFICLVMVISFCSSTSQAKGHMLPSLPSSLLGMPSNQNFQTRYAVYRHCLGKQ